MHKAQSGFNILELVVVLVVLAVLGAIAIPKLMRLKATEKAVELKELSTSLTTASAANYKIRKQDNKKGMAILNCTDVAKLLPNSLPEGYAIISGVVSTSADTTCTVLNKERTKASFVVKGIN